MTRAWRALDSTWLPHLVAAAPIVMATGRALDRGWIPMGDNAYFSIRARDVLTEHHPLLGAWSSGSGAVGVDVNNLGPLQLDLLAPFVRVLGFGPGTAVGVAAVNIAATVVVVLFARRRLGSLGAWAGALMSAATAWVLGSELLFEPRQHHALVLPFLALLVVVWSLLRADRKALPVAVVVASLVAQTHLTFAQPAIVLTAIGTAGAAAVTWAGRADPAGEGGGWRSWKGSLVLAVVIGVTVWAQPLAEELGSGEGNISALREAASAGTASLGLAGGARAAATVLAPPDGWWRPSFRAFDPEAGLVSAGTAAVVMVALAAAHGVMILLAWRRGDRPVSAWLVASVVAVAAAVLSAATSPTSGPFGAVSGNYRYLWPVAVFATAALLVSVVRLLPDHLLPAAKATMVLGALGLVVASVPTSYQSPGPEDDARLMPVARSLREQVLDQDLSGSMAVDRSGLFFGEPYTYVVLAALQESGVDIVLDAPTDISRFGEGRRRDGQVDGEVTFVTGPAALEERPGSELLARASLLTGAELDEALRAAASDQPSEALSRGTVAVWFEPAG